MVLLPGNVVKEFRLKKDEEWASNIANKYNIKIIYEKYSIKKGDKNKGNHYALYAKSGNQNTGEQKFATSTEVNNDSDLYKSLADEINKGDRTISLKHVEIGVLICGENNILVNKQAKQNKVKWRYEQPKINWNPKIIINPSHNSMGNWNKLNKRFEFLSKKFEYVIYLTNSSHKTFGKSSLRVYKKGVEIKNGEKPDFKTNDNKAIGCIVEII
ncbi:MAG: hypothetical protein DRQ51_00290 [Gammaproteobacteria bacterium]|nr:MAG: hypothetical protein DRQ51_00290 [Gammaproteobacteria bacterium]